MVQIKNSKAIKEIIAGANLQFNEEIPKELARSVVPTLEINPKFFRVCNIVKQTTLAAPTTLYTTPANKDFYLDTISGFVEANGDSSKTRTVTAFINGESTILLYIKNDSTDAFTTANSTALSITPQNPIKLDRNSTIIVSETGAGGTGWVSIIGFTEEPIIGE